VSDKVAKSGDKVSIHYVGRLQDQTVLDSTEGKEAFRFELGSDEVLEGVNKAVIGMKEGEKKSFELKAADAFGEYDEELLMKTPREQMPEDILEKDVVKDPVSQTHWMIEEITADYVLLNGNHELAGERLYFEVELVSIDYSA